MKKLKQIFMLGLLLSAFSLSSCLHILEEVTFNKAGNGKYKMSIDMGEMKGMMDMLKTMGGDSTAMTEGAIVGADSNPMSTIGQEMSGMTESLKGIEGISNVVEINDTSSFNFGYSFDFASVAALNKALQKVNKDKYPNNAEEVFKFDGKKFERLGAGDLGAAIKSAMAEEESGDESQMDMLKMFFGDMSYKQVYHFPDRTIKKSSNELSELSDEDHTVTINLKPFDEEQQKKNVSVATAIKLK